MKVYADFMQPLRDALQSADDFEALEDHLNGLQIDKKPLADYLQRVMVTAHLAGRQSMQARIDAEPTPIPSQEGKKEDFAEVGADVTIEPLTMEEALEFMRAKKIMGVNAFKRLTDQAKRSAFAIANAENDRVLELVRDELAQAISEGLTFADFADAVNEIFDNYGVTEVSSHHLETIFRTNIQSAYHQGAHDLIYDEELGDLVEFLQYSAIDDDRTRADHARWDGVTLPKDDPWWDTHYPPNGYNCRCDVIPITKYRAARENIRQTDDIPGGEPDEGFRSAPELPTQEDLT